MKLKFIATLALMLVSLSCSTAQRSAISAEQGAGAAAPVQICEKALDFTLEDQEGRKVTLSSQYGKTTTVLVFYRGSW